MNSAGPPAGKFGLPPSLSPPSLIRTLSTEESRNRTTSAANAHVANFQRSALTLTQTASTTDCGGDSDAPSCGIGSEDIGLRCLVEMRSRRSHEAKFAGLGLRSL